MNLCDLKAIYFRLYTLVVIIGSYFLHVNKLTLDDENEDSEIAACSMDPLSDSSGKLPHFSAMYTHTRTQQNTNAIFCIKI